MNIPAALALQFNRQTPNPAYADLQQLGRAIAWRIALFGALPVTRSISDPFPLVIHRQIEDELDRYQREINDLADDPQTGNIDDGEFQRRMRNLTIAILLLAFLRGSQIAGNETIDRALEVLRSGGQADIEVDYSQIPPDAAEDLQSEIDISVTAGTGLATAILAGRYEDRGVTLASRLAMWATTALGVYGLGQLWRETERNLAWGYGPTDHCSDCRGLNGQVHTVSEWRTFYLRTQKRPQSHTLACGGWSCQCGLYETNEPTSGNFI